MRRALPSTVLWSNLACLAPVLALALVLAATAYFNARINLGYVTLSRSEDRPVEEVFEATQPGSDLADVASQLTARLGWALPAIALLVMSLAALGGGLFLLIWWVLALGLRRRVLFLGATLAILAAVTLGRTFELGGDWLVSEPGVFKDLRTVTLYADDKGFSQGEDSSAVYEDLDPAEDAEDFLVLLAYLSFAVLLAAASASLAVPEESLSPQARRASVADRARGLRWLLYLGAGVLVLHAMEIYAFYRWPGVWLPPEQAELVDQMAHGISAANGAFFSLLLLALYLPAAGILRLRGLALVREETAGPVPAEQRQQAFDEGVLASPLQELSNLLITLGPLLAGGPLAGVLDLLHLS